MTADDTPDEAEQLRRLLDRMTIQYLAADARYRHERSIAATLAEAVRYAPSRSAAMGEALRLWERPRPPVTGLLAADLTEQRSGDDPLIARLARLLEEERHVG